MNISIAWEPLTGHVKMQSELGGLETIAVLELSKLALVRDMSLGRPLVPGVPKTLGPLPVRRVGA